MLNKRNTQTRRHQIVKTLEDQGETSVEQFSRMFDTSEVTIRKDLAALEGDGLVLRRHGGAILMPTENLVSDNNVSNRKKGLGELAASLVQDHDRIVIDSGSTTGQMLKALGQKRGLVVMTNSLQIAHDLLELEREPTVLMTGGTWDTQSHSFQGAMAEKILRSYNFDKAFIGAAGLDIERGTTTYNELIQLTSIMAEVSREIIIVAESQKFAHKMPNLELPWSKIDKLITDTDISANLSAKLREFEVEVLLSDITN